MWYNVVQEYGEVHDSQPGINALPPQLRLEGRQIAQRSIKGRAAAFVSLELVDKLLAFQGTVVAHLHDAHSLQDTDKMDSCQIAWTGTVSHWLDI